MLERGGCEMLQMTEFAVRNPKRAGLGRKLVRVAAAVMTAPLEKVRPRVYQLAFAKTKS